MQDLTFLDGKYEYLLEDNELTIYYELDIDGKGSGNRICKWFKLPKKQIDLNWIANKLGYQKEFINLSDKVISLIGVTGLTSLFIYPASYGIGISRIFRNEKSKEIELKIWQLLKQYDIDYVLEDSSAGWVLRVKISKAKTNLLKLANIDN